MKLWVTPGTIVLISGLIEIARRCRRRTTTTLEVSTLTSSPVVVVAVTTKVPSSADENRPSGRMVPPVALQVTGAETLSPASLRPRARNRISWLVSTVTLLGLILTVLGTASRGRQSPSGRVLVPSGAVASPPHAAKRRMAGSMLNLRETASLRASLNVYVIFLSFHCSPRLSPNRSPGSATTLGL